MTQLDYIDADAIAARLPLSTAVDALESALRGGLDPEADAERTAVSGDGGELLVMPSSLAGPFGVKLVTVRAQTPRIQGVYVLFDPETLAPRALLDGVAMTAVRTAAVSAVAVRHLAAAQATRLLVFGSGPQAYAHVEAMRAVRPVDHVQVAARDATRTGALVEHCRRLGMKADAGDDVEDAHIICCCTTAREPLFEDRVADYAVVVAIGSHEADAREVDEHLAGRATVVVESRSAALREAGDVIQAIRAGTVAEADLVTLADVVNGTATIAADAPRLFKSVGMSWQDAVLATVVCPV